MSHLRARPGVVKKAKGRDTYLFTGGTESDRRMAASAFMVRIARERGGGGYWILYGKDRRKNPTYMVKHQTDLTEPPGLIRLAAQAATRRQRTVRATKTAMPKKSSRGILRAALRKDI